ncbi:pickpocket protein 28-like [Nilaparvata lugens]|uniref:pickpocket protein 28-like n=1 Tax=Nilaparvata lugens TaxID=108931 RepID=UPI00193DD83A|nr:pickpocket protein 28-like [Nilaparvata lugens]
MVYFVCGKCILDTYEKWMNGSIVSTIDPIPRGIWEIPFPAITFCSENQLRHSQFDYTSQYKNRTTNYFSDSMRQKMAVADIVCRSAEGSDDYVDPNVFSYMVKERFPNISDTIVAAIRVPFLNKSLINLFETTLTMTGVCFTFNLVPLKNLLSDDYVNVFQRLTHKEIEEVDESDVWNPDNGYPSRGTDKDLTENGLHPMRMFADGMAGTIAIVLQFDDQDYDEECNQGGRGFTLAVHSPAELPSSIQYNQIHLKTGHMSSVYLNAEVASIDKYITAWPPEKRGCVLSTEHKLYFFKIYTQKNCDSECSAFTALKMCGCVAFHQPRNTSMPICGSNKWSCLLSSFKVSLAFMKEFDKLVTTCFCPPACSSVDYQFTYETHAHNVLDSHSMHRHLIKNVSATTSYSIINLAFKVRQVYNFRKAALMGVTEFIAAVGGIMGLFLGCSFLSFFELLYFLSLRIIVNLWNARKIARNDERPHDEKVIRDGNTFNVRNAW